MEEKDQEKDKPLIPEFKEPSKPQLRIKGLTTTGTSIVERLKAFKKKDLAFILAGMGVLFMAPLAEHFMMSPDSTETGAFKEGWGFRGGGEFGKGGSPYEGGIGGGLAPGGVAGNASDVITPLNVRDPSSLVMGPGATQQPATSAPAASPKESSDWKDALANAAGKSAKAANQSASLPVPKVPLTNAGLRGLGAVSGGTGASFSLPAISAGNVPNKAAPSRALTNVRAPSGYRGAAGARGPETGGTGGYEALKKAAGAAGGDLNRSGSASGNLETAASRDMSPTAGGDGFGAGGKGDADKAGGQGGGKDSKSAGESLEFLRLKAEQDKALDLKWSLIKKQAELWPNLKEEMLKKLAMAPVEAIADSVKESIKGIGGGSPTNYSCYDLATPAALLPTRSSEEIEKDCTKCSTKDGNQAKPLCIMKTVPQGQLIAYCSKPDAAVMICNAPKPDKEGKAGDTPGGGGLGGGGSHQGVGTPDPAALAQQKATERKQDELGSLCAASADEKSVYKDAFKDLKKAAEFVAQGNAVLMGASAPPCKVAMDPKSAFDLLAAAKARSQTALEQSGAVLKAYDAIGTAVAKDVTDTKTRLDAILQGKAAGPGTNLPKNLPDPKETAKNVAAATEGPALSDNIEAVNRSANEALLKANKEMTDAFGLLKDLDPAQAKSALAKAEQALAKAKKALEEAASSQSKAEQGGKEGKGGAFAELQREGLSVQRDSLNGAASDLSKGIEQKKAEIKTLNETLGDFQSKASRYREMTYNLRGEAAGTRAWKSQLTEIVSRWDGSGSAGSRSRNLPGKMSDAEKAQSEETKPLRPLSGDEVRQAIDRAHKATWDPLFKPYTTAQTAAHASSEKLKTTVNPPADPGK